MVRRSTSFKQHPFLQSVSEHKLNISFFLLFPLLFVTHFLAFTSRSAGSSLAGLLLAHKFPPWQVPQATGSTGDHAGSTSIGPALPGDRERTPLTLKVEDVHGELRNESLLLASWFTSLFVFPRTKLWQDFHQSVSFGKRQTWRQDSRRPKIHAVFPPCNFITLLLSGPTLAKKTAGIFNNICFVSAKVAYAHNKNINITEGLIMKSKLTPLQSQPCFSEANPFSGFSWEFSLYLIYRFSKCILSKHYQSTLCYER